MSIQINSPRLSTKILPLMDIIFILLAFFMILPHGSFEKKTSDLPSKKSLQNLDKNIEIWQDIPLFLRISPSKGILIQEKVSSMEWKFYREKNLKPSQIKFFLKKLKEALQRAEKQQKKDQKRWELHKKLRKNAISRAPKILIQMEIHRMSAIWLPIQISRFLKKYVQKRRKVYILAIRSFQK